MNYYIADLHLDHYNIMKYSNRPFRTVLEMNITIINNCKKLTENDDLYILGDICMVLTDEIYNMFKSLKCKIHLIIGNHDSKALKDKRFRDLFVEIKDYKRVNDNGKTIILFHYPIADWDGMYHGSYHFYGHVHNNNSNRSNVFMNETSNAFNVGADILGFMPMTADQIISMKK